MAIFKIGWPPCLLIMGCKPLGHNGLCDRVAQIMLYQCHTSVDIARCDTWHWCNFSSEEMWFVLQYWRIESYKIKRDPRVIQFGNS